MRTLLLVATFGAGLCLAQPSGATPLKLEVGKSVVLDIINQQTICDNAALVSVERGPGNSGTQLTGLKVGKTQCSLGAAVGKGVRQLYDLEVVAPAPEPKKLAAPLTAR